MLMPNRLYPPDSIVRKDPPHQRAAGVLPPLSWYAGVKVVADSAAAVVLLALSAPVLLVAALLVKLTSRGPALYSQTRLGKDNRRFTIYKLRTMYHNCEKHSGPQWSTAGDPRITPLGRFLRKTHLDELPQLWNVLKGDMSLVGPRPERPEFVPGLEKAIAHYGDRLRVRPGMTGLAQVQLPPDTNLDSVRRKLAYDLYYIRYLSPVLDLQILLSTACYCLGIHFHSTGKWLRVPTGPRVEQAYEALAAARPLPVPHLQPA